jgi:hypothetical protein
LQTWRGVPSQMHDPPSSRQLHACLCGGGCCTAVALCPGATAPIDASEGSAWHAWRAGGELHPVAPPAGCGSCRGRACMRVCIVHMYAPGRRQAAGVCTVHKECCRPTRTHLRRHSADDVPLDRCLLFFYLQLGGVRHLGADEAAEESGNHYSRELATMMHTRTAICS